MYIEDFPTTRWGIFHGTVWWQGFGWILEVPDFPDCWSIWNRMAPPSLMYSTGSRSISLGSCQWPRWIGNAVGKDPDVVLLLHLSAHSTGSTGSYPSGCSRARPLNPSGCVSSVQPTCWSTFETLVGLPVRGEGFGTWRKVSNGWTAFEACWILFHDMIGWVYTIKIYDIYCLW